MVYLLLQLPKYVCGDADIAERAAFPCAFRCTLDYAFNHRVPRVWVFPQEGATERIGHDSVVLSRFR